MKATKASIQNFLSAKKVAVAGVTRNPKEFGYQVFEKLKSAGKEVFIVHPVADQIAGQPCYKTISVLPAEISHLLVLTNKKATTSVVTEALAKGISSIWIQQMSDTPEAIDLATNKGINLVTGECILMHTEPVTGAHKFHRAIRRFFGRMPG